MSQLMVRDKAFYKTTLKIALSIILQGIITIGVNMMDTVMPGSYGEIQIFAASHLSTSSRSYAWAAIPNS